MSRIGSMVARLMGRAPRAAPSVAAGETDYRMLAESSTDAICRIGPDMAAVYMSPSVETMFGWTVAEMIGGGPGSFIHPDDAAAVAEVHRRLMTGMVDQTKVSYRILCKDGTALWVEATSRLVRDPSDGGPGDVVINMRDISDRKRLEEELRALSLTDGLTGLANRRAFDDALAREWRRTSREGSQLSLLLLDIDHFKRFNDLYGHQAGDDCLRVVAAAIRAAANRPGDLVARYGGEEIALILPSTVSSGAAAVAECVRAAVEAIGIGHAGNDCGAPCVTVSIGAATAFARPGGTMKMPEGLLMAADGALYKAKREGRNRVSSAILLVAREDAA